MLCSAAAALAAHAILPGADVRGESAAKPGGATADHSFDAVDVHRLADVPSLHDHSFAPTISPPPPPPPPPRGDGDAPRPQLRRARESSAAQLTPAAVLSFPTAARSVYEEYTHAAQAVAETGRCSACGAYASRIEWDEAQLAWYYGTNDGRTA